MSAPISYQNINPETGEIRSGFTGGHGRKRHAVKVGGEVVYCEEDRKIEAAALAGRISAAIQRDLKAGP